MSNSHLYTYDLAILIVSYNVGAFIERCLESIHAQLAEEKYIISIVDNASADDSVARIRQIQSSSVILTSSSENLGFGRGVNLAARQVRARYYLVLNPDTILVNDIVSSMKKILDEKNDAAVIGCPMINEKGDLQPFSYQLPGLLITVSSFFQVKRLLRFGFIKTLVKHLRISKSTADYLSAPTLDGSISPVGCVPGCGFLVRSSSFQKINGFDENIFLYMEDCDLFLRLQQQGYSIHRLNQTGIVHLVSKSFSGSFTAISPHKYWSTLYYFRKHGSAWTFQLIRAALFASSISKWIWSSGDQQKARYRHDAKRVIGICLFGIGSFNPFVAKK